MFFLGGGVLFLNQGSTQLHYPVLEKIKDFLTKLDMSFSCSWHVKFKRRQSLVCVAVVATVHKNNWSLPSE